MSVYNKIEQGIDKFHPTAPANARFFYNKLLNLRKKWTRNKKVKNYFK